MKTTTIIVPLLAAIFLSSSPRGEEYQCREKAGCFATRTKGGVTELVIFRRGDLVGTESGWVVDPADGWLKVWSGRLGLASALPGVSP